MSSTVFNGSRTYGPLSSRLSREIGIGVRDFSLAFFFSLFTLYFLVQPFRIEGRSMSPGLEDRQLVLVDKVSHRLNGIRRGDVIVFSHPLYPDRRLIKRVIGSPGDSVSIRGGKVLLNQTVLSESYLNDRAPDLKPFGPVTVPPGSYFVLGDHRGNSRDSRTLGPIPAKRIIGRAFLSIGPVAKAARTG